jgi:hypothetical protein
MQNKNSQTNMNMIYVKSNKKPSMQPAQRAGLSRRLFLIAIQLGMAHATILNI